MSSRRPDDLTDALAGLQLSILRVRDAIDAAERVLAATVALNAVVDVSAVLNYLRGSALDSMRQAGLSDDAIAEQARLTPARVTALLESFELRQFDYEVGRP